MDFSEALGNVGLLVGIVATSIACVILFVCDFKKCEGPREKQFIYLSALLYVTLSSLMIYLKANIVIFLLVIFALNKFIERKRLDIRRFGET